MQPAVTVGHTGTAVLARRCCALLLTAATRDLAHDAAVPSVPLGLAVDVHQASHASSGPWALPVQRCTHLPTTALIPGVSGAPGIRGGRTSQGGQVEHAAACCHTVEPHNRVASLLQRMHGSGC